jgi:methanogenic corrinoid protein MtbC1
VDVLDQRRDGVIVGLRPELHGLEHVDVNGVIVPVLRAAAQGAAVAGRQHIDAGWDAVNLGPNTPFKSLGKAIHDLRPRLLWLTVSHLGPEADFLRDYTELYRQAEKAGVAVAIGGRALVESLRSRIPYTTYGDGLGHLVAFARTLHPRPHPPRRGRPSRL